MGGVQVQVAKRKREGGKMPIGAALPLNGQWKGQPPLTSQPVAGAKLPEKKENNKQAPKPPFSRKEVAVEEKYAPQEDRVMF
jgi:hypothetical protein